MVANLALEQRINYHSSQDEDNTRTLSAMDRLSATSGTRWGMTTTTYESSLGGPFVTSPLMGDTLTMSIKKAPMKRPVPQRISVARRTIRQEGKLSGDRKSAFKEGLQSSVWDEASYYNTPYHKKAFMKYGVTPGSLFSDDTLANLSNMVFSEDSAYTDATFMETIDRIQNEVENIEKMILNQRQKQELLRERTKLRRQREEGVMHRDNNDGDGEWHRSVENQLSMSNVTLHKNNVGSQEPERNAFMSKNALLKEKRSPTVDKKKWKSFLFTPNSSLQMMQSSQYSGSGPFETSIEYIQKMDASLASIPVEDISGVHHIDSLDLASELAPASMKEFQLNRNNFEQRVISKS